MAESNRSPRWRDLVALLTQTLCAWLLLTSLGCGDAPGLAPSTLAGISPSNVQVAQGTTERFSALGHAPEGTLADLTRGAHWQVQRESGELVSEGETPLLHFATPGRYLVTASVAGQRISTPVTVTAATLSSLSLSPSTPSVPLGRLQQFKATAKFSDGTTQDVTAMAAWSVKDTEGTGVGSVDAGGLVQAKALGKARVQARYELKSTYTTMTVTPAALTRIEISPSVLSLPIGLTEQFQATGIYTDGSRMDLSSQVTWAVQNVMGVGVLTLTSTGRATAKSEGVVLVSAELTGTRVESRVTVTPAAAIRIQLVPPPGGATSAPRGTTMRLLAKADLSDGTTGDVTSSCIWSIFGESGPSVASVNATGLISANNQGSAIVQCIAGRATGTRFIEVTRQAPVRLTIAPANARIPLGATQTLSAIQLMTDGSTEDVSLWTTWAISDLVETGALTLGTRGALTAVKLGRVRVTATSGLLSAVGEAEAVLPGRVTQLFFEVYERNPMQLAKGLPLQARLVAVTDLGWYQGVNLTATWNLIDVVGTGVASLGPRGTVSGLQNGQAELSGSYGGLTAKLLVNVGPFVATRAQFDYGIMALWGTSETNMWAGRADGTILRWDGTTWTNVGSLGASAVTAITGTSNSDVWIGSRDGTLGYWNGMTMRRVSIATMSPIVSLWRQDASVIYIGTEKGLVRLDIPTNTQTVVLSGGTARNVWGTSATDIWAVGSSNEVNRFDGMTWSKTTIPMASSLIGGLGGTSATDVWALTGLGVAYHFDGVAWTTHTLTTSFNEVRGLLVHSATEVWVFGTGAPTFFGPGAAMRWDGTKWTLLPVSSSAPLGSGFRTPSKMWFGSRSGPIFRQE
jgi:hypothetical protein